MSSLPDIYPNLIGDEAADDFLPISRPYDDAKHSLSVYLHALAAMFKPIDDIARDGPNEEPGWSQLFDLTRAKTEWLPWTGQLVGYTVPIQPAGQSFAAYDAEQRVNVTKFSTYRRGTVGMMIDILKKQLNPPQRVLVTERYGGDPWQIRFWVYSADIRTSAAEITKAAVEAKFAGLLMSFSILTTDNSYDVVNAKRASYQAALTAYTTYDPMYNTP
jgi:hypothetical protein